MSLTKLFNRNYLMQNLKKSKVVLSIFIGLIPILNTILLIMRLTNNNGYVLGFSDISLINFIGVYFLPIIISICLFNYLYKKASVDFVSSMPISRKSIFVTNIILAIAIFILMLLSSCFLIFLVTLIFNTPIPFMMIFDYFWFNLLIYVFAFCATSLAMSISGNAVTQIIVTLLLFFLLPFSNACFKYLGEDDNSYNMLIECKNSECYPKNYYCYDDLECSINKELDRYEASITLESENNYTTLFAFLYDGFVGANSDVINRVSVFKMIFLSIVYALLSYFLFLKRKLEVSETSFKSIHMHNLIRSLTLVPIVFVCYVIMKEQDYIFTVFALVIILIYYFIYDLVTKRSIQNIKISLAYFGISVFILFTIFSFADKRKLNDDYIKYSDIEAISVDLSNYVSVDDDSKIYINDKKLISLMVSSMLDQGQGRVKHVQTYLKTKDNKEYKAIVRLTYDEYDEMINLLNASSSYVDHYKNIDMNLVYALKIGDKLYSKKEAKPYLDLISNSLKKMDLGEFLSLQEQYRYKLNDLSIKLYTYEDHDRREKFITGYIDYELLNSIVNANNMVLKEDMKKDVSSDYLLYYKDSNVNDYSIDYYVLRSAKNEIYNFIFSNILEKVDMRDEYFSFELRIGSNAYQFTTNKVDDIIRILNKKYEEVVDTQDYKDYYSKNGESVYYD